MFEVLGVLIGVGGVILFGFISSGVWKKEKNIALNVITLLKTHFFTLKLAVHAMQKDNWIL